MVDSLGQRNTREASSIINTSLTLPMHNYVIYRNKVWLLEQQNRSSTPHCLQYHYSLSLIPASCDGCGDFSLAHALDCHRVVWLLSVIMKSEMPWVTFIAALRYRVVHEPVVCDGDEDLSALIAELEVRGVWIPWATV